MDIMQRTIFFVSDGTGITAEALGHSLLSQFEGMTLREVRMPFIDTPEKIDACVQRIAEARAADGVRPVVVTTLVQREMAQRLRASDALVLDFFDSFIAPLESEFGRSASHSVGRARGGASSKDYQARVAAIDFSVTHDDGVSQHGLELADIILVGVSRSGKTPTSLYLALQFGLKAANYPLIPEDFERAKLPQSLAPHKGKCFGLSINPQRLAQIRNERRPGSKYAAIENCRYEVAEAELMMRKAGIAWLSSTHKSIEEIATTILRDIRPDRLIY